MIKNNFIITRQLLLTRINIISIFSLSSKNLYTLAQFRDKYNHNKNIATEAWLNNWFLITSQNLPKTIFK